MRMALVLFASFAVPHLAFAELPSWLDPRTETESPGGGAEAPARTKRLSVSLGVGLRPDMANLGQSITKDGTLDIADSTVASLVYATEKALMSDRDNEAIYYNSRRADSAFNLLGEQPTLGGPLLGLDLGVSAMYELDDLLPVPLFVRAGFHRISRVSGGEQSRTLGDAVQQIPELEVLLVTNGLDPADYVGGTMRSNFDAAWTEVPFSVGFKVPLSGHSFVYASAGISWFNGGFSVEIDVDERYAKVLATHIDTDTLEVADLSPGAVNETVEFKVSTLGVNYGLGAQVELGWGIVWYLELNASGAAKTVLSSDLKPETRRLLTAASSQTLAEADPEWFKRLAFPVVVGGGTMRTGVRVYVF